MNSTPENASSRALRDFAGLGTQPDHLALYLRAPDFLAAAARGGHRLPWLVIALLLHVLVLSVLFLPTGAPLATTPPVVLDTTISIETRVRPAPPPLKPVTLTKPQFVVTVPPPVVSIADPAPSAVTAVVQTVAPVITAHATPPAPDEPVSPPRFDAAYLHNPSPSYPAQSRRQREQGTVMLRVDVSSEGKAAEVLVEHSSGWPLLDQAAIDAVKRWRFTSAHQGGHAVAAWVLVPIEFDLHG